MVHDDITSIQVGLVLVEVKRVEVAYCNTRILHKKIFPFMFIHIENPMCYHTIYLSKTDDFTDLHTVRSYDRAGYGFLYKRLVT